MSIVLVTGASTGIGALTATALALRNDFITRMGFAEVLTTTRPAGGKAIEA